MEKITPDIIRQMKGREPIAALTVYDYPMTRMLDGCGMPLLLVGDSLGMVVLGLPDKDGEIVLLSPDQKVPEGGRMH